MNLSFLTSAHDTPCHITYPAQERRAPPELFLSKWEEEAYVSLKTAGKGEKIRSAERVGKSIRVETNKRQHLIHRLDDENIEYDILLPEPPRQGEIKLPLEFPRGLSFYKQGASGRRVRPEVQGSYAVYHHKKNNRYKTGKLCHIYRPRLFDARGHWAWGELEQDGESLVILLPENFMKRATYPVTVDPVIGTSSVGASHQIWDDGWRDLYYEMSMPANSYTVPQTLSGNCTAYFYSYHQDSDARGYPVLYSNNSGSPQTRLSSSEVFADLRYPSTSGQWLSAGFTVPTPVAADTTVWFAFMARYMFYPYFDESYTNKQMNVESNSTPPGTFVVSPFSEGPFLLSMYFTYVSAQNYSRSITLPSAPAGSLTRRHQGVRHPVAALAPTDLLVRSKGMDRSLGETPGTSGNALGRLGALRKTTDTQLPQTILQRRAGILKQTHTTAGIFTALSSLPVRLRKLMASLAPTEALTRRHNRIQKLMEEPAPGESPRRIHQALRENHETMAQSEALTRRGGFAVLARELTQIWDYLTRRKTKSKEEVILFSPVTQEAEIHSPLG